MHRKRGDFHCCHSLRKWRILCFPLLDIGQFIAKFEVVIISHSTKNSNDFLDPML